MEDYKKKYEDAVKKLKKFFINNDDRILYKHDIESVFPELKESEDERIKKSLIGHLKECRNNTHSEVMLDEYAKWIAWLEKQDPNRLEKEIELAYKTADEVQYRKGFEDGVASVKPTDWSEEGERICQCLIEDQRKALNEVKNDKYGHSEIISDLKEMYRERIEWLESIKERMKGE